MIRAIAQIYFEWREIITLAYTYTNTVFELRELQKTIYLCEQLVLLVTPLRALNG